ncbi:hypothetical protein NDU88_003718 [Pleurodeles waltl]|uniref:Uncharacterized protein n=1 Tax=Pleurodeles waltl TaxID=8319 RepID=A0AAV7LMD2_PLEWA|nr:hypothetical protein NDU88_003718 [Pleurodeles waltl]
MHVTSPPLLVPCCQQGPLRAAFTTDQWTQGPVSPRAALCPDPAAHQCTRTLVSSARGLGLAALNAPALRTTSGAQHNPRRAPAARRPPGASPHHFSWLSGHQAQGPTRDPRPPAAGASTGHAAPLSCAALPQAPWDTPPSGASGAVTRPPNFTLTGVAEPYRTPRRQSTDKPVRSRRHLGHAPRKSLF